MWVKWGSWVYGFYDLKLLICDDGFRSQQGKWLLSGDGRAVFEVIFHKEPIETLAKRPLSKSALICPISASDSDFNPRNIQYIPVVKIFAFLDLDQN